MPAPSPHRAARPADGRPEGSTSGRAEAPVPPFVLCTASPRRVALLAAAGVAFERGAAPDVDETPPAGLAAG